MRKETRRSFNEDLSEDEMSYLLTQGHRIKSNKELEEESLRALKQQEKRFIKEGVCEECGAYDVLFNLKGSFLCGVCKNNLGKR